MSSFAQSLGDKNASPVTVQVSQESGTLHFEFSGRSQWDYNVDKKDQVIEIEIGGLSPTEISRIKSFKSDLIKQVTTAAGADGKTIFKFETVGSSIESFDYLTDQPSRLIIDIFKREEPGLPKKAQVAESIGTKKEKSKAKRDPASDSLQVSPNGNLQASSSKKWVLDANDPDLKRFDIADFEIKEDAIIASKDNYFAPLPLMRAPFPFFQELVLKKPVYEITKDETEENKQARLILTLSERERTLVALQTIEWYLNKFPNSKYDEIVRFLKADNQFKLWLTEKDVSAFDQAMASYQIAAEKYPDSPLASRSKLLTSLALLDRGDWIKALERLQAFAKQNKTGVSGEVAKLAEAHTLYNLKKYNEAIEIYQALEKSAQNQEIKFHASFNQGDVYTKSGNSVKANEAYQNSWNTYPNSKEQFPSSYFNQAQNEFVQKNYKNSLSLFREFLKTFPNHPYAPVVMARAGEILEILGAPQSRVVGAWLETQFRYGETPLTLPARLRLLGQRFTALKDREIKKVTDQLLGEISKSSLPGLQQMGSFIVSEGYLKRGNYTESREWLERFYKENLNTVDKVDLRRRIVRVLQEEIKSDLQKDSPVKALQLYEKYKEAYFKHVDRVDTQLALANAYQKLGGLGESEKRLKIVLNRLFSIRGTPEEKERKVLENLPKINGVQLSLGKAFFDQNKKTEAYNILAKMENPEDLSDSDQIERVKILSQLMEARGESESAIKYLTELIREWQSEPLKVAAPYLELALVEKRNGKTDQALRSLKIIDESKKINPEIDSKIHLQSLLAAGEIYDEKKDFNSAAAAYSKAVELYPESINERTRFRLGQIYSTLGETKKAEDVWKTLDDSKQTVWSKIAKEQMQDKDWKKNYNKYIQRIPAAETIKKEVTE